MHLLSLMECVYIEFRMKSFGYLFSKWEDIRVGIPKNDLAKLYDLFSLEDTSQVTSSFELLYSYGDAVLCALLTQKADQLVLREDLGIKHRVLWGEVYS